MIQSPGGAGDSEIVILGIILRDFLVDILRVLVTPRLTRERPEEF